MVGVYTMLAFLIISKSVNTSLLNRGLSKCGSTWCWLDGMKWFCNQDSDEVFTDVSWIGFQHLTQQSCMNCRLLLLIFRVTSGSLGSTCPPNTYGMDLLSIHYSVTNNGMGRNFRYPTREIKWIDSRRRWRRGIEIWFCMGNQMQLCMHATSACVSTSWMAVMNSVSN